ncbi:MAG: DUF63 family protein [Archaeoglobaceae archaeon]
MDLWGFIKKYYIDSLLYKEGYNVVNTITFAAVLLVAVYLLYRFLEKRFTIDRKFVLSTVPYIIFGSSVRVVEDAGFLTPPISYVFMSPFIFFLIFLLAFPTLLLANKFAKERYYIPYSALGFVATAIPLTLLFANMKLVNPLVLPYGLAMASVISSLFYLAIPKTRNLLSFAVMFSHMLDGFVTFIGIQYHGYVEIHVLPSIIVDTFGAFALPVVKFAVIAGILYFIDTSQEKIDLKNFIKLTLLVFGLAPALRNGLRISFGV